MRVNFVYVILKEKGLTSTGLSIIETCALFKPPAKGRSVKRHSNAVLQRVKPTIHTSVSSDIFANVQLNIQICAVWRHLTASKFDVRLPTGAAPYAKERNSPVRICF